MPAALAAVSYLRCDTHGDRHRRYRKEYSGLQSRVGSNSETSSILLDTPTSREYERLCFAVRLPWILGERNAKGHKEA